MPLCSCGRPTLEPVGSNEIQKCLLFRKKAKNKNSVQRLFSSYFGEAVHEQGSGSGVTKLLSQELHSASWHTAAIALSSVCEHLCFISIYFVHLLTRCVLR